MFPTLWSARRRRSGKGGCPIRWPTASLWACSAAAVLAGCAEDRDSSRTGASILPAAETATIPGVVAERLADRADRLGEPRATCRTRQRRLAELRSSVEAEIRADRVPVALRGPLRSRVAAIPGGGACIGDEDVRRAEDLGIWLRKRSAAVHRTPPDFRVARSSLADDPADDLVWAVVEPMWWTLETPYEADPRLAQATPGQRAAYALTWTESEVANGGFEQYFWNSTGMLLDEAISGARLVGARDLEVVLRDAGSLFPGGRAPESRDARQEALDAFSAQQEERLAQLDERFFALLEDPAKTPGRFLKAYIRDHPTEFFFPRRA